MRFLHREPAPVLDYLHREPVTIEVLDWDREIRAGGLAGFLRITKPQPAGPARPASVDEVAFIGHRGHDPSHGGTVLRFYFHINRSHRGRPLPLVEAVEHVEASATEGEFVLAGYPDGGLISVSRDRLPFQEGDPITWWGP